jgi:hypothetical protein
MLWIGVGTQVSKAYGHLKLIPKPYSIEGCRIANQTTSDISEFVSTTIASVAAAQST